MLKVKSHERLASSLQTERWTSGRLLRTWNFKLGRRIDREVRANAFVVPFQVNAVGRMITRFRSGEHGSSSCKLLFVRGCKEILQSLVNSSGIGLWPLLLLDVESSRPDSPEAYGSGKSEIDDAHLVVDFQR